MATVGQSRGDPAAALMGPLPTPPGRTGDASELARESDATRLKIRELSERNASNRAHCGACKPRVIHYSCARRARRRKIMTGRSGGGSAKRAPLHSNGRAARRRYVTSSSLRRQPALLGRRAAQPEMSGNPEMTTNGVAQSSLVPVRCARRRRDTPCGIPVGPA